MTAATVIYFVPFLFIGFIGVRESLGCDFDEFSCKNGQCIPKLNWCDSIQDCKDNSDENYCRYEPNSDPNHCSVDSSLFLCSNGKCIPIEGKCDDLKSCDDGSDENFCDSTKETTVLEMSTKAPEYLKANSQQNRIDLQTTINYSSKSNYISDLHYDNYKGVLESALSWLLSKWNEDIGWGDDTARAIIALYLSNTDFGSKEQKILMNKQLDIQLLLALTRNSSNAMSLCELSHYINALSAACRNPRNFNGYDLVSDLRDRVDLNYRKTFVTPYVYLTLCIHNFTRYEDILNLLKIVRSPLSVAENFDLLSLSVLAVSCAIKTESLYNPNYRTDILAHLIKKIDMSGIPKNIYELSLVVQALTETKVDPSRWHRSEAMNYILNSQDERGSFGDFLATYYTIPTLSGRSMLDISAHCNIDFLQELRHNFNQSKIQVFYSIYFGYPIEMTQKIQLSVAEGSNFLEIMHLAQEENPFFRFKLDGTKDIPFVYSIGGVPNDAERGLYWTLYVNPSNQIPYERDIRHHIPKENEESVFWLRPTNNVKH